MEADGKEKGLVVLAGVADPLLRGERALGVVKGLPRLVHRLVGERRVDGARAQRAVLVAIVVNDLWVEERHRPRPVLLVLVQRKTAGVAFVEDLHVDE